MQSQFRSFIWGCPERRANCTYVQSSATRLDCYVIAAKTGDATAQTAVGRIHYQGTSKDVPQNYELALFWLQKALRRTSMRAEKTLSDMYMLGQGTKRDPEPSRFYAGKAAEQNATRSENKTGRNTPRLGDKSTQSEPQIVERKS